MRSGIAACLWGAAGFAIAAEGLLPVQVWTESGRIVAEEDSATVLIEGGVRAEFSGLSLAADRAVAFRQSGELYIEGGVRATWEGNVLESASMLVRFHAGEALVWKARLSTSLADSTQTPVHIDADLMRVTFSQVVDPDGTLKNEIRIQGTHGQISVCRFGAHDMGLVAKRMTVRFWKDEPALESGRLESGEAYDGGKASLGFSTYRILGFPVLPLPPMTIDLKDPWLKSFEYGSRRRFGTYAKTLWGQTWSGRRSSALRELDIRKLQVLGNVDWYELRGWGGGPDVRYKGRDFRGRWEFYGIDDKGGSSPNKIGEQFSGTPNRWRLRFVHQHDFSDGWSAVAEIHRLSDSTFRNTYFETEERSGRPIENRLWVQKVSSYSTFWVTTKIRNNNFLTETEYMPQVGLQYFSLPLEGADFLYSSRTEAANVRRNNAERVDARGESFRTHRVDTEQKISRPFETEGISWEPYAGFRETYYQEGSDGQEAVTREAFLYGGSASAELARTFDVESTLLAVDRLHHNMILGATLTGVRGVTEEPERLLQFDGVDAVAAREMVDLSVRNLFLTKRGPQRLPATFADVDWRSTWFPNPRRDNPVSTKSGRVADRDFSNFRQNAVVFPRDAVTLRSETEYNPYDGAVDLQTSSVNFSAGRLIRGIDRSGRYLFSADLDRTPRDWSARPEERAGRSGDLFLESGVGLAVEHRIRRDVDTRLSAAFQIQFTERWGADYELTRELEPETRWQSRRLTIHRQLHDGAIEFHFEVDEEKNERIFSFNFTTYSL